MREGFEALASDITEGDFLVDIDNGYVYKVDSDEYDTRINFHTSEGEEGCLVVPGNVILRVKWGK